MAACEHCWQRATARAATNGKGVAENYHDILDEVLHNPGMCPDALRVVAEQAARIEQRQRGPNDY